MKKLQRILLSLLAVLLGLFCFVGCGGTDTNAAGTYKFDKIEIPLGDSIGTWEVGKNFMGQTLSENSFILVLNEDNTFTLSDSIDGSVENRDGTWKEEKGTVTLTVKGVDIMSAALDGDSMILSMAGQKRYLKR